MRHASARAADENDPAWTTAPHAASFVALMQATSYEAEL
jgi:hypothetical protein